MCFCEFVRHTSVKSGANALISLERKSTVQVGRSHYLVLLHDSLNVCHSEESNFNGSWSSSLAFTKQNVRMCVRVAMTKHIFHSRSRRSCAAFEANVFVCTNTTMKWWFVAFGMRTKKWTTFREENYVAHYSYIYCKWFRHQGVRRKQMTKYVEMTNRKKLLTRKCPRQTMMCSLFNVRFSRVT